MYFDSNEITDGNKASRVIPLAGSFVEALSEGKDANASSKGFQLVCPSRSFVFSCSSAEVELWIAAIAEEIDLANSMRVHSSNLTLLNSGNHTHTVTGESTGDVTEGSPVAT